MKLVGEHFEKDLDGAFDWYAKNRVKLNPGAGATLDFVAHPRVRATPTGRTWKQAKTSSLESAARPPFTDYCRGHGRYAAAAEQGHILAMSQLAQMYMQGQGTPKNEPMVRATEARDSPHAVTSPRVSRRAPTAWRLGWACRGRIGVAPMSRTRLRRHANAACPITTLCSGTAGRAGSVCRALGASVGLLGAWSGWVLPLPCACSVLMRACCVLCGQAYHWMGRHALALHDKEQGRPPTNVDQLLLDLVGDHL